jgi:hypothetical protein
LKIMYFCKHKAFKISDSKYFSTGGLFLLKKYQICRHVRYLPA